MPGCSPAPNAQPSTVPRAGTYVAAPWLLYDQEPPGEPCQYDQYAEAGEVVTHLSASAPGFPLMRHTKPCWRDAYV